MADFLEELKKDLQKEAILKFWNSYKTYCFLAIILILIGMGGFFLWARYQDNKQGVLSQLYDQALEYLNTNQEEKALNLFEQLSQDKGNYSILASLQRAALLSQKKEYRFQKQAHDIYQTLLSDIQYDKSFEGVITLSAASHITRLQDQDFWKQKLEEFLTPFNPWKGLALELKALHAFQEGSFDQVNDLYQKILTDKSISVETRQRAINEAMGLGLNIMNPEHRK